MTIQRLLIRLVSFTLLCVLFTQTAFSQTKTISGTITDDKGAPVQGATVTAKGSKIGTSTKADGTFTINVPPNATVLVVSSVGFTAQDVAITGQTTVAVSLVPSQTGLNEVVVIGYGTARKKELSGSYSVISAKDFNSVPSATPDQLLQGRIPGLEVVVSSGQPGSATQVKIRGNNSVRSGTDPLYVVDGIPLDGRSARPSFSVNGLGQTPDANALTWINPADIESISVLKDAAASAIYGSRGANGVIIVTTRTGTSGPTKIDAALSIGTNGLMRQPDVLDPAQYRTELAKYGAKSDSGASYKPFKEILQHDLTQNYSVAMSGGSENAKFRASFLASRTPGLVRKSELDRYIGNINGSFKIFDKRVTLTFGVTTGTTNEEIAPISNNPGSTGSMISNALQWNPTLLLKHGPLQYTTNPNGQINPLVFSDSYNDHAYVTTLLAYASASWKIFDDLEYKLLYGANYGTGNRGAEIQGWITGTGNTSVDGKGTAIQQNDQLFTQSLTHTLTYNHKFNDLAVTALGGYEYYTTHFKWQGMTGYGFDYNTKLSNLVPVHYYDNMQDVTAANLTAFAGNDPAVDLQSYFARVQLNYQDKYSISGSFRADGSNKFGSNNKYGYFPAISARWGISDEEFMKDNRVFTNLALRASWGQSGNQSFPAGAALDRFRYNSNGALGVVNYGNKDLKWETVTTTDVGIDFGFFNGRLTGTIDGFIKKTTNPLYTATYATPAPAGTVFKNLDGYVSNKGFEFSLVGQIIKSGDWSWSVGGNATYVKNKFVYPPAGTAPLVLTGQLNGKGTSATYVQAIANNQPIDVFYLRKFHGYDQNGFAITDGGASYAGDPNPKWTVGLYTNLDYKKWSMVANFHGNYDFFIYNNTLQSVTGLSFINNGSNISKTLLGTKENPANPVSASTRYMSSGNYMKLGNLAFRYRLGDVTSHLKNATISLSGNNLFVISKYPGFDPEVNVVTADANGTGIPSTGIDYVGYPTVRSFTLGINFSLN
ncbi:SusC/RagA family TonB-linked outer membrane protein [Puia sp.]|jgi:iron complex outermembrane receptor protein|uniref:SusC/RagA family TonB-linked outer membrane protein n=1 Tax=Puia sp. TaxID=2045100 RepID=UPI002F400E8E